MEEQELRLDYCDECGQITNHIGEECQKCKSKELKKHNIDIDDDFESSKKKFKKNKFDDEED